MDEQLYRLFYRALTELSHAAADSSGDWGEDFRDLLDELGRLAAGQADPAAAEGKLRVFAALKTAAEYLHDLDWGHVEEVNQLERDLGAAVATLGVDLGWPDYTGCCRCQKAYKIGALGSLVQPASGPTIHDPCPYCGDIAEGIEGFVEAFYPSCHRHRQNRAALCLARCERCNFDCCHHLGCPAFQLVPPCPHGLWADQHCEPCDAEMRQQVHFYLGGLLKRPVL